MKFFPVEIKGKVLFADEGNFADVVKVLRDRFQLVTTATEEGSGSPNKARFPVLLTFRETSKPGVHEAVRNAFTRLFNLVIPIIEHGALTIAKGVAGPGASTISSLVSAALGQLSGKETPGKEFSGVIADPKIKTPTTEEVKKWIDGATGSPEFKEKWKQMSDDDWEQITTAIRSRYAPEPPDVTQFLITQIAGWLIPEPIQNAQKQETYQFTIHGATRFENAWYDEGARFDILGPDGSQLATKVLSSSELEKEWIRRPTAEVLVKMNHQPNLDAALARIGQLRKAEEQHLSALRGRVWSTRGRPLGKHQLAIYAPPAITEECGPEFFNLGDPCCCDECQRTIIRTPIALGMTETDDDGYFEVQFERSLGDLQCSYALIQVSGVRSTLAIALEKNDGKTRFPNPVLLQVSEELMLDSGQSISWSDDKACECSGSIFGEPHEVIEEFSYQMIIRTSDPLITRVPWSAGADSEPSTGPELLSADEYFRSEVGREAPIKWDSKPVLAQAATISHGRILTIKQSWRAAGYSLGDLIYSLPLAPLQKKNIAIIDWNRQDISSRTEQVDSSEALSNVFDRDRDISEIMKSSLSESTAGESHSGSSSGSGGGGLSLGFVTFGGSGGSSNAWSSSSSNSSRQLASDFMNHLKDKTSQVATAFRSQRSTTVQQVSQAESNRVVTETIANRNACHAITLQYFEVLRHFEVSFEVSAVRECLYIPLPITSFNPAKVLRWRDTLRRVLPSDELRADLDSTVKSTTALPLAPPMPPPATVPVVSSTISGGTLEMVVTFTLPAAFLDDTKAGSLASLDNFPGEKAVLLALPPVQRDEYFQSRIVPLVLENIASQLAVIAQEKSVDCRLTISERHANGSVSFDVGSDVSSTKLDTKTDTLNISLERGDKYKDLASLTVHSVVIEVQSGESRELMGARTARGKDLLTKITFELKPTSPRPEPKSLSDSERRERLMAHLNENVEAYHKAIWWNMDPDRRFSLLDGFIAPNAGGRSVASVVENRLVGIVGNCLVMPVSPGLRLDRFQEDGKSASDQSLLALYSPEINPVTHISVPTKGVFAEAVMGKCNSCERVDDKRNWRYWEHPLPDEPTQINPISIPTPGTQQPDLRPGPLPTPIVSQVQKDVIHAPDPSNVAAWLQVLAKYDAFRDAVGLAGTQESARAALAQSFATTTRFGELAAELEMQREELAAKLVGAYFGVPMLDTGNKLKESISKDAAAGRVDPMDAQQAISKLNDAMVDSVTRKRTQWPADSEDISAALKTASQRGAPISIKRGDSKVDLGPSAPEPRTKPRMSRMPWPLRLFTRESAEASETPTQFSSSPAGPQAPRVRSLIEAQNAAMTNPRYSPGQPNTSDTHCSEAAVEIAKRIGKEVKGVLADANGKFYLANPQIANLGKSNSGWHRVSPEDGQALANTGVLVFATQVGSKGAHGHIASVRPEGVPGDKPIGYSGPLLANIGTFVGVAHQSRVFTPKHGDIVYYAPAL